MVADKNILCQHHLRTQSTPVGRFDLYFQVGWLKLLQFDFYSRKFGFVGDPSQMHRGPTGKDRRSLSVTTGDCVAGKSAGYENQAFFSSRIFPRSFTFCLKHDIRLHVKKINGAKQNGLITFWFDVKTISVTERYALGWSFDDKLIARINRCLIGFRVKIFRAVLNTLTMLHYA